MSKFQDIVNKPSVEVLWIPPEGRDWREEFIQMGNRARETTWGFLREEKQTMWLIRQLEAAEIQVEAGTEAFNKVKGLQLHNGRLKAEVAKLKKALAAVSVVEPPKEPEVAEVADKPDSPWWASKGV